MEVRFYDDINIFYDMASPFLMEHEVENGLLFYVLHALKENINRYGVELPSLSLVLKNNLINALAIRTPPRDLLLSFSNDLNYIELLVEEFAKRNENLPGVIGLKEAADKFTNLWCKVNNLSFKLLRKERLYKLEKVTTGTLGERRISVANKHFQSLVLKWSKDMMSEALEEVTEIELNQSLKNISDEIESGKSRIYLLFDNNEPVSMARKAGRTPNGIAVNLVYTPLTLRRNGYATECVAKLSHQLLEEGNKYCFLFTDLSNPISNSIYQKIGYRPIYDLNHYKFIL